MPRDISVTATVRTSDPEVVRRAMESLGRAATGLALEYVSVALEAVPYDEDEDGTNED